MSVNLRTSVICQLLWLIPPSIFVASCENIVRLADLQDTIKNQTKLIEEQGRVIEDQKNVI